MILAHKIALDPNVEQVIYFARACGTARFSWNWALAEWQRQYKEGGKPSEAALRKQLNTAKREQFPWMLEVTKVASQQAIKNLGRAFSNFFSDLKKPKKQRQFGYPQFKKKGIHDSFRAENGPETFALDGKRIKLPVIGWVRMRETLRFSGKVLSATVSRVADRWFVSVTVEVSHQIPVRENQAAAGGIDLGVKALATMSDGSTVEGPKALRSNLKRLRRLSRSLSRKVKGSANRRKARAKVARLHARISNIRKDGLHKLTTELVNKFSVIGIEDLNVRGMMANGKLSLSIADMGFYEFKRQLTYKADMAGTRIVVADRWYPSSKTCSACSHVVPTLPLSVRDWTCPACGSVHDRDINAAINLKNIAASSAVTACGAGSSDGGLPLAVKLSAMKQELTHVSFVHD
jgi:putative transposase